MTSPPTGEDQLAVDGEEPQVKAWERFYKKHRREAINEAVLGWPAKRSIEVDWFDLDKHDRNLSESLLLRPHESLTHAEEALKSVDVAVDPRPRLHVRVSHLPGTSTIDVRDLRSDHLGKLIAVKGLVKRATVVRPKIEDAVYQCGRCGCFLREPQEEHLVLKEPLECYEDQGGCGRDSSFKLIVAESRGMASRFVDTQKMELQEAPENMRGGEQPEGLTVYVEDDLCSQTRAGQRVTINGILRAATKKDHGVKSTLFDIYLEANSIERHDETYEDVIATEEEEEKIRRFAEDPEVYVKLRESIAPTLHGLHKEKETLVLQLFGGVEKQNPDKTRLRGDIHVLLVGDPGVAKSQLIRAMTGLAPRGIYTSGKSTSAAGLTAGMVKDDFGDGRWTIEAGAMVLADRGLLCVDEIDKMDKKDQSSMHEGMEQQSITLSKVGHAGISLPSRCSVLGAANPKLGRFDESTPIPEQFNFPTALLSRFDVIFVLRDTRNSPRDRALVSHIADVHRGGAMLAQVTQDNTSPFTKEQAEQGLEKVQPIVEHEFLRKFVAYAKRTCFPVLSLEAKELLVNYYDQLRNLGQASREDNGPLAITVRQFEALIRLAEASARIRLSRHVVPVDAQRAISIYEVYMKRIGSGEGGIMDVDMVASGVSHSQRQAVNIVKQAIRDLEAGNDHGADYEELVKRCEQKMITPETTMKIVERLKGQGEAYSPRENKIKLTGQ